MPEPLKLEREPPETERSEASKSVETSERLNVIVVVSPAFRDEAADFRATPGLRVSTENVSELSESLPS